ncbi:ComF family protein [bacterium]|nr:ComF family protein [bacterium]
MGLVAAWKYRGCRGLASPLAELADAGWDSAVAAGGEVAVLVPIPLHPRRRRERGFNQAALLAGLLAARRDLPVLDDLLLRSRATGQQAKLSSRSTDRDRNVAGAFGLARRDSARDLRVGLVDDLVTSGATALAAAACLRGAGVRVGWVLAAGLARRA